MLELTSLGQRVADDVGSRKRLQGISAQAEILLELKGSQHNLRDLGLVGE